MKKHRIVAGIIDFFEHIIFIMRVKEPFRGTLILPGGKVEPGESLEAAIKREMLEETGLRVLNMQEVGFYDELVYQGNEATHRHLITIYRIMPRAGEIRDSPEGRIVPVAPNSIASMRGAINPSDYRMIERVVFNKEVGFRARISVENINGKYRIMSESDLPN